MEERLNAQLLQQKKHTILEIIKKNGPSLPSSVSREINLSLLFTAAIISDLVSEKLLKISNLKVGGSPLYYSLGQEHMLDNFTRHLPLKEQEAHAMLKEQQVVRDENVEPAFRVGYRSMKDFAVPMHINVEGADKIFWRHHNISEEDALKKIDEMMKKEKKPEEKKEEKKEIKEEEKKIEKKTDEIKINVIDEQKKAKKERKNIKKGKADFAEYIYEHLKKNGIEVEHRINEGDVICTVFTKFDFGKAKMLVVAHNKKKINEADLSLAYQQGLSRKMPVLFLINGELTKKAQSYLEMLGNYIFIKKL